MTIFMSRDLRFDVARCLCMFWVIGVRHLSQYLGGDYNIFCDKIYGSNLTYATLGVFSLVSGFFIGQKYIIDSWFDAWTFYKKRLIRFYPLFVISSLLLVLIGFNTIRGTLYALIGITSFTPYRVATIWYMSMLLCFYVVTPLVSRKKQGLMSGGGMFFSLLAVLLYYLIHGMDARFPYNMALYYGGIICAWYKNLFLRFLQNVWMQIIGIISFVMLICLSEIFQSKLISAVSWPLGVWAILSVSVIIANALKSEKTKRLLSIGAYATLVYYLFHRLFYYFATHWIGIQGLPMFIYLFLCIFPLGWIASYWIQKIYDAIVNKYQLKTV